jgi:DNA-binding response OmpR family regulator
LPPPHRFVTLREEIAVRTVLVVEDEMKIARLVRDYLEHAGFEVIVAHDGDSAVASARGTRPDLIVLDLGLPGRDGLDVTRELRRSSSVPIVMLTARGDEADRVVGLELGADDYMVKPFSPKELVARVRAVLRRTDAARTDGAEVLRASDVEVDVPRMRATAGGRPVDLTPTEFRLLAALVREPGRVFTRGQLLDAIHGVAIESYERAVDAHVKNIRKKLEPTPTSPRYLLTVRGVGYRFADA